MKTYTNRVSGLQVDAIKVNPTNLQEAVMMLASASTGAVDYSTDPYLEISWCGHTITTGDYIIRPVRSRQTGVMSAELFAATYEAK